MNHNYKHKGNIGETAFLYKMTKLGVGVSIPYGDNEPYDFIIRINNICYTVQVKTGSYNKQNNTCSFMLTSIYFNNGQYSSHDYKDKGIDLFAFYCVETNKLSIIPFEIIDDLNKSITICYNDKSVSRQKASRWFYEDIKHNKIINQLKRNNKITLKRDKSKNQLHNEGIPEYILSTNDTEFIRAYRRVKSSALGFRGVFLNDKGNLKYKSYVYQENKRIYVGKSDDLMYLVKEHDKIAEQNFGATAITNKRLGLL